MAEMSLTVYFWQFSMAAMDNYPGVINALGPRIRGLREGKGWSMEKLAREIEMSRQTVQDIELGKQLPRTETLIRIAKALSVSASSLLEDVA